MAIFSWSNVIHLFIYDADIVKNTHVASSISSEPKIYNEKDVPFAVKDTERKEIQLEVASPTDSGQRSTWSSKDRGDKQLISTEYIILLVLLD